MSDHDEPMDEMLLRQIAEQYRPPPPTPREAMWSRIDAARRRRQERRQQRRWVLRIGFAAAAALLIGVALGRLAWTPIASPPAPRLAGGAPSGSTAPAAAPDGNPAADRAESPAAPPSAERAAPAPPTVTPPGAVAPPGVVAARFDDRESAPAAAPQRTAGRGHRGAALRHLDEAEALLVDVRNERAAVDSAVAAWASQMLGTTRLLLDSRAGEERELRRLLEDLELVLAQIALAPGTGSAHELELIRQTLEERAVMLRLRSATARSPRLGT